MTQNQQTTVTNLQNSSLAIKYQLSTGTAFSAGFSSAAGTGTIVDPNTYTYATVSEQQRLNYNQALTAFSSTDFYTARQFLLQQAAAATVNMQTAISALATATADLQKAVIVNQTVSTISDAQTARQAQSVLAATGLSSEISGSQVSAYNSSLASVNSYASQAASFFRAAGNTQITTNIDNFKTAYGKDLSQAYAVTGYGNSNPYVVVGWQDGFSVGSQGGLETYTISAQAFYGANAPAGAP